MTSAPSTTRTLTQEGVRTHHVSHSETSLVHIPTAGNAYASWSFLDIQVLFLRLSSKGCCDGCIIGQILI